MRILLVEDDKDVAETVGQALAILGHSVIHAASVVEAVELVDGSDGLDVAILDVDLAGGTSAGVACVLSGRSIPFIVATGHTVAETPDEMRGKPHLRKPYLLVELERALELCLTSPSG